jgi:flagellar protein FlbD
MIQLTRLNHQPLTVNSDLVKFIEKSPDTVISLVNGEKIVVEESVGEVVARIVEFRRSVLRGVVPPGNYMPAVPPSSATPPSGQEGE